MILKTKEKRVFGMLSSYPFFKYLTLGNIKQRVLCAYSTDDDIK
jgi:hypothetical protein